MIKHDIQVIIVDSSKVEKCDIGCGVDWSSSEAIALARRRIKERFSNRVELEYLDLSQPVLNPHTLKWQQRVRNGNLSLPLLIINGGLRISGQFDIRQLLDAIDAEIEIRR